MIYYHAFVDFPLFAPVLTNFMLVTSKVAEFSLGNLDQTPSAPALEPKPSESASSTLNQPETTPVQAESVVETAPVSGLGDREGVEAANAPVDEDTLAKTPPGELQLLPLSSILTQHLDLC
jgi:hypothetical protein